MFLTVGCGRNDDTGHISEETRRRLRTLDDSIDAMSPKSLSMIAGGMASA